MDWEIGAASFKRPTYFEKRFLKGRKTATKILKILSVDKDAGQLGLSYIAGVVQDSTAILEKSLALSYKVRYAHTICPPNFTLGC